MRFDVANIWEKAGALDKLKHEGQLAGSSDDFSEARSFKLKAPEPSTFGPLVSATALLQT